MEKAKPTAERKPQLKDPYQVLLNYSFRLLGKKAYSEKELTDKLTKRANKVGSGDEKKLVAQILYRLKELNYINDQKILENYFEYRLEARPVGKFKFLHEMYKRGINKEHALDTWEKKKVDEEVLARKLIESKERVLGKVPLFERKKKIAQMLAGRGFAPGTVWSILDTLKE